MTSLMTKAALCAAILSLATALPAEAAKKKRHQQAASVKSMQSPARYRDQNTFAKGPVSFGGVYLGDDPDPFIRFQLLRDASGRFGGDQ